MKYSARDLRTLVRAHLVENMLAEGRITLDEAGWLKRAAAGALVAGGIGMSSGDAIGADTDQRPSAGVSQQQVKEPKVPPQFAGGGLLEQAWKMGYHDNTSGANHGMMRAEFMEQLEQLGITEGEQFTGAVGAYNSGWSAKNKEPRKVKKPVFGRTPDEVLPRGIRTT